MRINTRFFGKRAYLVRAILQVIVIFSGGIGRATGAEETVYCFAYFQGGWPTGGSSGVYLSYSHDGLEFLPLNDGEPIFLPPKVGEHEWADHPTNDLLRENKTRDPSIAYGPDGLFHIVWTTGIETKSIGHATSPDLVKWSTPQRIELWSASDDVSHTWAPEIFYDTAKEHYLVVWASNPGRGDLRLFYFTTVDFQSISRKQILYYNGDTVIDGAIAWDETGNEYIMAIKDERNGRKNIWLAHSAASSGPWECGDRPIIGKGAAVDRQLRVEGPSLIKVGRLWHLYYDRYDRGQLSVATSGDLTNWTLRIEDAALPRGRHGTVFAAPTRSVGWIKKRAVGTELNRDKRSDVVD